MEAMQVDIRWWICFSVAVFISAVLGNRIVAISHDKAAEKITASIDSQIERDKVKEEIDNILSMQLGGWIGAIERCLYIFAIMWPMPTLLGAVLLFKAFSNWAERPNYSGSLHSKLALHYLFVFGSFASLIVAIALGEMALFTIAQLQHVVK